MNTTKAASMPISMGSTMRSAPISRSWLLPGAAQICRAVRVRAIASGMCEDIDLRPAGEIAPGAARQEIGAGLRQRGAALARQALVEFDAQREKIPHVRRR